MRPLINELSLPLLERLATRSHFRYGKQIADQGKLIITKQNVFNSIATVALGEKEKQTTELHVTAKGLRWKCSCSNKKNFFCQHCVALGLYMVNEQSSKH